MAKVRPEPIERQLAGINNAVAHATRLFRQGIISQEELHGVESFALEQRMGPLLSTEEYVKARENGDFERYEAIMNDSRTPSGAAREAAARKVCAHYVAEQALNEQLPKAQTQQEHNAILRDAREKMSTFINMDDEDADNDIAVWEKHAKIALGDEVEKPVEEPSWSKPVIRVTDDDPDVRAFKLRDENTSGTKRYNAATDAYGEKRDSKGRYIPKHVLREDADKVPTRKNSTFEEDVKRAKEKPTGSDRGDGFVVDEWGVMTPSESAARDREDQAQREANDRAAAAEATPAPSADSGPVILPSPSEA